MFNKLYLTTLYLVVLQGKGTFAVPYDSTQGVPGFVFLFAWILIGLFLLRLAWEYRDKIFTSKSSTPEELKKRKKTKKK